MTQAKLRYKTIRIPEPVYDNVQLARKMLVTEGIDSLPKEIIDPRICPVCGKGLEGVEISFGYRFAYWFTARSP